MQFTLTSLLAVAAVLPAVNAHLRMGTPTMFKNHKQAEGFVLNPLDPSGSDFPCQGGIPDETVPPENFLQLGSDATLQIKGSAVHGGGSGQMVISYDFPPSKDTSKWRVLTSYEGNHPMQAEGNLTPGQDDSIPALKYKVWEFLPKGKAIVAWNWFNHIGNREHYMKCAVVSIGGSTDAVTGAMESEALKKLPTMFRANSLGSTCITPPNEDPIKFKNPGNSVFGQGKNEVACDASTPGTAGNRGSGGGAPSGGSTTTPPTNGKPAENEGTTGGEKPAAGGPPAPGPSSAPATPPTYSPPAGGASPPAPVAAPVTPPTPATPPATGGACTEGAIICTSATTWSMCGSGKLQPMGATAAGMNCVDGKMVRASAKVRRRDIRFSGAHKRRRHLSRATL